MIIEPATRDVIRTEVARRMAGSKEAQQHTHIECNCDDLRHRHAEYDVGCFCPPCAAKHAVSLGYPATDTEPETEGLDDNAKFCETCGALITTEGLTPDGIDEELSHWVLNPQRPNSAAEWREFALCLADPEREPGREYDSTDEQNWERIVAVMLRETPWRGGENAPEGKGHRKPSRAKRKAARS